MGSIPTWPTNRYAATIRKVYKLSVISKTMGNESLYDRIIPPNEGTVLSGIEIGMDEDGRPYMLWIDPSTYALER